MPDIEFEKAIVCDDIRQEDNGKHLIIGLYAGAFIPPLLPMIANVQFGIWAKVEPGGEYRCNFEVMLEPGDAAAGAIEVQFDVMEGESQIFMPLPKFQLKLVSPGFLILRETIRNQEILRLRIDPARASSDTATTE